MSEIQLSYRSTRPATTNDEIVIDGIVLPAMRFNRQHNITGCLWVGPNLFYQVLEGRPEDVDPLFASIARDGRHADVELLSREPCAQRQFGRFSMKLVTCNEEDQIAGLLNTLPSPHARTQTPHVEVKPAAPATGPKITGWSWQPAIVRDIVSHLIRLPNRLGS